MIYKDCHTIMDVCVERCANNQFISRLINWACSIERDMKEKIDYVCGIEELCEVFNVEYGDDKPDCTGEYIKDLLGELVKIHVETEIWKQDVFENITIENLITRYSVNRMFGNVVFTLNPILAKQLQERISNMPRKRSYNRRKNYPNSNTQ